VIGIGGYAMTPKFLRLCVYFPVSILLGLILCKHPLPVAVILGFLGGVIMGLVEREWRRLKTPDGEAGAT